MISEEVKLSANDVAEDASTDVVLSCEPELDKLMLSLAVETSIEK